MIHTVPGLFLRRSQPPCERNNRLTDRTPSKTLFIIEWGDQLFTSYHYWLLFFAHVQISRNIYSKFTWLGDTLPWVRSPCIHPGKYHMGAHTVMHVLSIHNLSVFVLVWRPTASWWRISCCFFLRGTLQERAWQSSEVYLKRRSHH